MAKRKPSSTCGAPLRANGISPRRTRVTARESPPRQCQPRVLRARKRARGNEALRARNAPLIAPSSPRCLLYRSSPGQKPPQPPTVAANVSPPPSLPLPSWSSTMRRSLVALLVLTFVALAAVVTADEPTPTPLVEAPPSVESEPKTDNATATDATPDNNTTTETPVPDAATVATDEKEGRSFLGRLLPPVLVFVLIAAVISALLWWWRRRRQQNFAQTMMAAQPHSEAI